MLKFDRLMGNIAFSLHEVRCTDFLFPVNASFYEEPQLDDVVIKFIRSKKIYNNIRNTGACVYYVNFTLMVLNVKSYHVNQLERSFRTRQRRNRLIFKFCGSKLRIRPPHISTYFEHIFYFR